MLTAYFDCFSGISGNMILGSFVDAGLDLEAFKKELKSLPVSGYEISLQDVSKNGIHAKYIDVSVLEDQPHRHLKDIEEIIIKSTFTSEVKDLALRIFKRLGEAESLVHGTTIDKVHFHEVGAVDSIIDILGAAYGFTKLGIEKVYVSPLHVGSGMVKCAHGLMPIPAPATAEILKGMITYSKDIKGELVTPTGAAIISELATNVENQPKMKINKISYGAGTWDLKIPNVVRLILGEEKENKKDEDIILIETNIDDMNPEFYSYIMEKLYSKGVLEVYMTSVQMKKNRPGILLSVICDVKIKQEILEVIFNETTTLGVRIHPVDRVKLLREQKEINTPLGNVRIKISKLNEKVVNIKPEYDDCKKIAEDRDIPLKTVWQKVSECANKLE